MEFTMTEPQGIAALFGDEVATSLGSETEKSNQRVLVVDDSKMMRFAVAEVIRKLGFEVMEAADGDEALALIDSAQPSLIFLDINMPRMGGVDVLETLRSDPKMKAVPVVILTVEKNPELMRRVVALQVKDYLIKPAKPSEIKKRVAAYLS